MKRMSLSLCTALVFFVAAAVAQSTPQSDPQGTQGSYPSTGQGTSNSQTGMQGSSKAEKKLKGCIESQGGQYTLQEKSGKNIALTGADLSAHVGHEVAVHGSWESGAGSSSAASSTGSSDKAGKQFNVTSVDMISESCGGSKKSGAGMNNPSSAQPPQ
jgi:Protein of unknown function (DUF5818)